MSYQVLARKWRPRDFSTLVGQEHVVRALTHALDGEPAASRVALHRHARRRQDDAVAHPRQGAQLHRAGRQGRHHRDAVRRVRGVHRDRCRPLRRLHRDGRREQPRRRRDGAVARARDVRAEQRALQGLHDRRGAPAVRARVQRDAEDARRAARLRQVHPGDHRPAEGAGHGAVALPAVQPEADDAGRHRRAHGGDPGGGEASKPSRRRCGCWRRPRAAACATDCRCSTRRSPMPPGR